MGGFTHLSVLLQPVLDVLAVREGGIYVDGTLGGGGYAEGMLRRAPGVRVVGIDRDPAALAAATARLEPVARETGGHFEAVHGSFGELEAHIDALGLSHIDGLALDLGVSSHQLDVGERGFSFMRDGPLDMRMDPGSAPSAADLVAQLSADELATIFRDFGEERRARHIARAVVRARGEAPLTRTLQLAGVVESAVGRYRGKGGRSIHPATRVFQALRIAVNGELDQLQAVLPAAVRSLAPGGRLAVVSFHSLEDRMVKRFIAAAANPCTCPPDLPVCACGKVATLRPVARKGIVADDAEVAGNVRARSARLRGAERVGEPTS